MAEPDQTPKWAVYNDEDKLVAVFVDEQWAWNFAKHFTAKDYTEDGCYYVEKLDVQ